MNAYFPEDEFYETGFSAASERYRIQIDEILGIMDKPELDVDDNTQFWDYYSVANDPDFKELKDVLFRLYSIEVDIEDYFWEAAQKIHEKQIL